MATIHPIHRPNAAYSQPEVHVSYPAEPVAYPPYLNHPDDDPDRESLTGETKGDETSAEEWALSDTDFSAQVLGGIGIQAPRLREEWEKSQEIERTHVFLPVPTNAAEEKELHESVMTSLRKRVAALEEEELFESSMKNFTLRSSVATDSSLNGMVTVAGDPAGTMGEPNAAGLGEQPRTSDVKELLRADIRDARAREHERRSKDV